MAYVTAAAHLAAYGISVQQAHDWVFANLGNPALVHQVASQYAVTTGMLAEIAGSGVTSDVVLDFFQDRGIDASSLDAGVARIGFFPSDVEQLGGYLTMNTSAGMLSTDSLRSAIEAHTGDTLYWELFSPNRLEGAEDGLFAPKELDPDINDSMPATRETIESLFFGTMIKLLGAVDVAEHAAIQQYASKFSQEMAAGDVATWQDYSLLIAQSCADPADPAAYSESVIANFLVETVTDAALIVASAGPTALLGALLDPLP